MSNEIVVILVLLIIWLGIEIWLLKEKIERIEQLLTFWKRQREKHEDL